MARAGGSSSSGRASSARTQRPGTSNQREERPYDPRREARRQLTRVPLPEDVQPTDLDQEVRQSLLTLSRETADRVARHLVMTGRLLEDDPEQALVHARAAGALAGRVAVVREAAGLAAYRAGEWTEALSELRAARRMSGSAEHLPVLADCERALGRPERALAALDDRDVPSLDQSTRVELVVVVAGARRDLGQHDAAVLLLQGPARATTARRPWAARLWYAYADALLDAEREDEARSWFEKAADVDLEGATDAAERVLELDGVLFDDDDDGDDGAPRSDGMPEAPEQSLEELVAGMAPLAADSSPVDGGAMDDDATAAPDGGPPRLAGAFGEDGRDHVDSSSGGVPRDPAQEHSESRPASGSGGAASPFSSVPERPTAPPVRPAAVPSVTFVAAKSDEDDDPDA